LDKALNKVQVPSSSFVEKAVVSSAVVRAVGKTDALDHQ
jgi:hypothetical protein